MKRGSLKTDGRSPLDSRLRSSVFPSRHGREVGCSLARGTVKQNFTHISQRSLPPEALAVRPTSALRGAETTMEETFSIRTLEQQAPKTLRQQLRATLSDNISRSVGSEQVWLAVLDGDNVPGRQVCCYAGHSFDAQTAARRLLAAMLNSGARRFAVVYAFATWDENIERDIAIGILTAGLQRIESLLGVCIAEQCIVTGVGESSWWRDATGGD